MRKNRLVQEDYFDFDVIGIVSTVKEYKLVWHINEVTGFRLAKDKDLSIEFSGSQRIFISNFVYKKEHLTVHLLKNRLVSRPNNQYQFLIDELRQFDYLLKYRDQTEQEPIKDILSLLKNSVVIEYAAILEPALIKSRDNLIF